MEKMYALVGRNGDDGGRYLQSQHKQMKISAWRLYRSGSLVQVWLVAANGDLLKYDADATRRVTDYIVKARVALESMVVA